MLKLLLDANLSPETAEYLRRKFSFDVKSLIEEKLANLPDTEAVSLARDERRVIVTLDLDFGLLYHEARPKSDFGVLILRLRDQRVERINAALHDFFASKLGSDLFLNHPHALAVADESTVRVLK